MKNILFIIGSASANSSNEHLVKHIINQLKNEFNCYIFNSLKTLPHFDPVLSTDNPPEEIVAFRKLVEEADGVVICTPEYVFSIPGGLKNALEWCVSTTVFSEKPMGLITASADGKKGHEELQLILKTLMGKFTEETTLLISGIRGKLDANGSVSDDKTQQDLAEFTTKFQLLLLDKAQNI